MSAIDQITNVLATQKDIEAVHIVSHGSEGSLKLGADVLNDNNLETFSDRLKQWGNALSEKADILLYACNLARGQMGQTFVQRLSQLTSANIAAATNFTGSAALGGDWKLNFRTGKIAASLAFSPAAIAAYSHVLPSNDNFANAIVVPGTTYTALSTNVGTTGETGELNHAAASGTLNSLWWFWTAPASGNTSINTFGSFFDTTLAVYTGTAVNSLTVVVSNDDLAGFVGGPSGVTFAATTGTTYRIAVDGFSTQTGTVQFNLNQVSTPTNDNFATAIALTGTSATTSATNVGTTGEVGEPNHAAASGTLNSLWWSWTAPSSGTFAVDTVGSQFNTTLGVYTGTAVNSLTAVASNDNIPGTVLSGLTFTATAGTTYQIAVDGNAATTGTVQLNLNQVPTPCILKE